MRLAVHVVVDAPIEAVWSLLVDWERQPEWMLDALDVEVLTPQRTGVGVTIRCPTRLLGVIVDDTMRVTEFDPPHRLAVVHLGRIIRGRGAFQLARVDDGTRVEWWEEVDVPLGAIGAAGATLVVLPVLERLFLRSLGRFAALAETTVSADGSTPTRRATAARRVRWRGRRRPRH